MNLSKHWKVWWFVFPVLLQMCTVTFLKQTLSAALTGASTKCDYSCHFLFVTEVRISCFHSLSWLLLSQKCAASSVGTLETNKGSTEEPSCRAPDQQGAWVTGGNWDVLVWMLTEVWLLQMSCSSGWTGVCWLWGELLFAVCSCSHTPGRCVRSSWRAGLMEQLEVLTAVVLVWDSKDLIHPLAACRGCESM